jgi:quinol monooxygenase YgiN
MTFAPETVESFLEHFDASAPQIRSVDGCQHLELWRDADAPHICTTYSHWLDADALDRYRHSAFFRSTWAEVKPLFADRPEAHSYTVARSADAIRQATDAPGDSSSTRT